jgi:pimeloyl-ACP methyl ester carboxylesterase
MGTGRRRWTIVLTAAAASLVAACGSGAQASSATSGIDWKTCGDRLECATVSVPLDWANPAGQKIGLAVIKRLASKPDQRIGSLFVDPGGPGDTGVGLVRGGGDDIDAWGDGRFDVIGWDPRGTHASSPVKCFTSDAEADAFWKGVALPSTPADSDAFAAKMGDLAHRCGAVMGPLLSHISTADTVRDLDALRAAVGEEKITYAGLSYGTVIGQMYANMFPQRVRAMMLDGLVDPVAYTASAETRAENNASSSDEVFDQFLTLCDQAGPARCALAGHGQTAAQRVSLLVERLKQGPIPAPNATPPGELYAGDLPVSTFAPMRDPALWPEYAKQLNAAVDGDVSALATAAAQARTPAAWDEATKSSAISCLDGPATKPVGDWATVIGQLTATSGIAGPVQGWWLWAPCAANWPAHSDDRYTGPWNTKTTTPILLIGTRHDPNTGYQNAVRSEKLLGNAVLLTHEGYGHLSFKDLSACVEQARVRYLVDLQTPPRGTVCAADKAPFQP